MKNRSKREGEKVGMEVKKMKINKNSNRWNNNNNNKQQRQTTTNKQTITTNNNDKQQQQQASKHVPKCEMHGFQITSNNLTILYENFQHYLKKEKKYFLLSYITTLSQLRRFCSRWEFQ
jgi:hypothetical protein